MYLGTFSRRAQSLATFFIFVQVRISGTQCLFFIGSSLGISYEKKAGRQMYFFSSVCQLSDSYSNLILCYKLSCSLIFFFCVSRQIRPYLLRAKKLQVQASQVHLPDLLSSQNRFRLSLTHWLYHLSSLQMSCLSLQVL